MIPDRLIERDTLRTAGTRTSVEVRLPWYRALPASCIASFALQVDGAAAPAESLTIRLNDRTFGPGESEGVTDEWWFPTDSVVLEGELPLDGGDGEHEVRVDLSLYIPYIITDHGVLRIEEHHTTTMKAVQA